MKSNAGEHTENNGKIAGMIGLIILLMLVVVVLSCAAACSGGGAVGFLVLALGWGLVLWFGISQVRMLKGKRRSSYEPMP